MKTLHVPLEDSEMRRIETWREQVERAEGKPYQSWRDFLLDRAEKA